MKDMDLFKVSDDEALERVKRDGMELRLIEHQTPEICMAAVKQDGYALRFVKEQTRELCLAAIQKDGWSLQYVKKSSHRRSVWQPSSVMGMHYSL